MCCRRDTQLVGIVNPCICVIFTFSTVGINGMIIKYARALVVSAEAGDA